MSDKPHTWKYGDYVKVKTPYTFWNGATGNVVDIRYAQGGFPMLTVQFDYGQTKEFLEYELECWGSVEDAVAQTKEALDGMEKKDDQPS